MNEPSAPSLHCAIVGSGSSGNATLIRSANTALLIDCGYSIKEFDLRCRELEFDAASLAAILVTHEHDDHSGGVAALARKYGLPVFATRGTRMAHTHREIQTTWQQISVQESFQIGDIEVQAVPVPHDAREPSQFIFRNQATTFGILTDLGVVTPHVIETYRECDALLLEFNHDPDLLAASVYPARLKRRIAGNYGHLSNGQAQALLHKMQAPKLKHVVAAHLSERTNTPQHVVDCLGEISASLNNFQWRIAAQHTVTPWFAIGQ